MKSMNGIKSKAHRLLRDFAYHHGRTTVWGAPMVFAIELTNHCNLKCIMCPRGEPDVMERPVGHMSAELFTRILDQTAVYDEPCWLHLFGEPLINPSFFERVQVAHERGMPRIGVSTNATLLNEENARKLIASPIDTVIVAIDGTDADVYERVRKSSVYTFDQVKGNAVRLLELRKRAKGRTPKFILSIIRMKETAAQLQEFTRFWKALGADDVHHKSFTTWGNQNSEFMTLACDDDRKLIAPSEPGERTFACKAAWESVVILWDGRVVPCCWDYDGKMTMGDLNRQTLAEVWNGAAYREFRRLELEGKNTSDLCRNCRQAPGHARSNLWPLAAGAAR